jgi:hypothetical protein
MDLAGLVTVVDVITIIKDTYDMAKPDQYLFNKIIKPKNLSIIN